MQSQRFLFGKTGNVCQETSNHFKRWNVPIEFSACRKFVLLAFSLRFPVSRSLSLSLFFCSLCSLWHHSFGHISCGMKIHKTNVCGCCIHCQRTIHQITLVWSLTVLTGREWQISAHERCKIRSILVYEMSRPMHFMPKNRPKCYGIYELIHRTPAPSFTK